MNQMKVIVKNHERERVETLDWEAFRRLFNAEHFLPNIYTIMEVEPSLATIGMQRKLLSLAWAGLHKSGILNFENLRPTAKQIVLNEDNYLRIRTTIQSI